MHATEIERLFSTRTFLTMGGVETYLHFLQGFALPDMCAFRVLDDEPAYARLQDAMARPIAEAARSSGLGLLVDALVWRASEDWIAAPDRAAEVDRVNALAVQRARRWVADFRKRAGVSAAELPILVAADVGPRGDGYRAADASAEAAERYHRRQLASLAAAGVDLVTALTMTAVDETIGLVQAARAVGLPVVVSATIETDGRLPDGTPLGEYLTRVDEATGRAPLFYMVNCAHPTHLAPTLARARDQRAPWLSRLRGFRANASAKSHQELDESPTLDRGDPTALAAGMAELQQTYGLCVVGGCCGTDAAHLTAIASAVRTTGSHTAAVSTAVHDRPPA